jgi:predicted ATPase/transcriptional regulator with XRE-family HTH domain
VKKVKAMVLERKRAFAELLRDYRRTAGLTQDELAERASLSPRALRKLESGETRTPRRDTIVLLATALNLSPEGRTLLEVSIGQQRIWSLAANTSTALPPSSRRLRTTGNLPSPLTPILGRAQEQATAVHLLRREDVRLLTLTGAPGIGKTRLALQVGSVLQDNAPDALFPDGVFLVELAPLTDPALVLPAIMRTLQVRDTDGLDDSPLALLCSQLRTCRLLLLLDNFEHLMSAAPQVAELLRACASLKVLVTSRVPLCLQGEHRLKVPPLALPDLAALPPAEEVMRYSAVAVFIYRAQLVKPTFWLTPAQVPAVAAICHRLDGLPLAIELAAAWTRLLSPDALLALLTERLPLLTAGAPDVPERQQTLRRAIAWSYELLSPAEQALFRQLAVFVGGWTLKAAEAVCGEAEQAVLRGLATLVDASLIDHQEETADGEGRFRLLELVREYALERLEESGEALAIHLRHAEYFVGLAEKLGPSLRGSDQSHWMAVLDREAGNWRSALEWTVQAPEREQVTLGLRLAAALFRFWMVRGIPRRGREWLERFLAAAHDAPLPLRARALWCSGNLAMFESDNELAEHLLEQSLGLRRALGDEGTIASALNGLGIAAREQGKFAPATTYFEEALLLWRRRGDIREIATVLTNLAIVAHEQGDYQRAVVLYEESLALAKAEGETYYFAVASSWLGDAYMRLGEYARAVPLLERGLALARELNSPHGLGCALYFLAKRARAQGNLPRAHALYYESLVMYRQTGYKVGLVDDLEGLAGVLAAHRQPERAARLYGAAATVRASAKVPLMPCDRQVYEQDIAALTAMLGAAAFNAAWEGGRAAPLEQLLAENSQLLATPCTESERDHYEH